jgi:hypothetical protein
MADNKKFLKLIKARKAWSLGRRLLGANGNRLNPVSRART